MIKLLLVDDDIATIDLIKDSIQWEKLEIEKVYTAFNVMNAKTILLEQEIDVIISDIEMPIDTGIDLLQWIREQEKEYEFLFLTCHENFSFASKAINYNAAAYLVKPLDIQIMEATLQKIINSIKNQKKIEKSIEFGVWKEENEKFLIISFWKALLEGEFNNKDNIKKEIITRQISVDDSCEYILGYTKLMNVEKEIEKYKRDVFEFIIEKLHCEILVETIENESVIKFYKGDTLHIFTICKYDEEVMNRCQKLMQTCKKYFSCDITHYISEKCMIFDLYNKKTILEDALIYCIPGEEKVFGESEIEEISNLNEQVLDLKMLISYVEERNKAQILQYLKMIFDELASCKKLNIYMLYKIKQEILQVIYTHMLKLGIQATKLFGDELSLKMEGKALNSTIDLIRWVNYLLEKTYGYEEEMTKNATIIEKINEYIHVHYAEDIDRNSVAEAFFFTPEYIAKVYKKKTGITIKDYINEYRIDIAKEYLNTTDMIISDVASIVGFDNFSYFSTVFKKLVGVSPKEYKK